MLTSSFSRLLLLTRDSIWSVFIMLFSWFGGSNRFDSGGLKPRPDLRWLDGSK